MAAHDPRSRADQVPQPVPVQLTSLIPVRVVSVHGDFFDTELHQDAPMRILQQAAEDCFKVRPELQLLTHNRQQINPNMSLRRNGCLLLKGDPYVKIVLDIKKGPKLNVVCQLAHHEPIPLACEATDTVWEVKKKLCAALAKAELTPQRIRLLWRYWELNDKATLDYYHLPTNAKLSVMKKRGAIVKLQQQHRPVESPAAVENKGSNGRFMVESPQYRPAVHIEERNQLTALTVPTAPPISPWPAPSRQLGHAVIPIDTETPAERGAGVGGQAAASPLAEGRACEPPLRPAQGSELVQAPPPSSWLEITQLKREVSSLERRIASCDVNRTDYALLEESYRATLGRVAELEAAMGRFQHLLKRALALM